MSKNVLKRIIEEIVRKRRNLENKFKRLHKREDIDKGIKMNPWDISNIGHYIAVTLLGAIITFIIEEVLTKRLISRKFIIELSKIGFYALNKRVRLEISHTQTYKVAPEKWLSNDIFKKIQSEIEDDELINEGINERCIDLYSKKLGYSTLIWLNEEFDPSSLDLEEPQILEYTVTIETDKETRLGRRELDELIPFITIATKAQEIIKSQCFPRDTDISSKSTTCDIVREIRFLKDDRKEIHDRELNNAEISIIEDRIVITLNDITYLVKAIKKYYTK